MFTGIVTERGRVVEAPGAAEGRRANRPPEDGRSDRVARGAETCPTGARLVIGHSAALAAKLDLGASIAVSGVCLTVVEQGDGGAADGGAKGVAEGSAGTADNGAKGVAEGGAPAWSAFDLSPETLGRTTLGALRDGDEVNLEPPLSAGDPLGGHWVQGHVDTTTRVAGVQEHGDHRIVSFEIPAELRDGVVLKGSVTIDGVSLTVAALDDDTFDVALIPHTLEVTTLSELSPGDPVNVEGDILARYLQKAVESAVAAALKPAGR